MRVLATLTITLPAATLARYAVHRAECPDRAERLATLASLGMPRGSQPLLRVDVDRGTAHLADGNHRTVLMAELDPCHPVTVTVELATGCRRAMGPNFLASDAEFACLLPRCQL